MARSDWLMRHLRARSPLLLLPLLLLIGACSSSSGNVPPSLRDQPPPPAPQRPERSTDHDWNETKPSGSRVRTGDTILNIRGAVRDAIADSTHARPSGGPATRVDAVVIRPAAASRRPPLQAAPLPVASPPASSALIVSASGSARILCELVNATEVEWSRDGQRVPVVWGRGADPAVWREAAGGGREVLVLARAGRHHEGAWRCAGKDPSARRRMGQPTKLLIHEPVRAVYLSVDGRRLDAGNTWVPATDAASLPVRCHAEGGVPAPELTWKLTPLDSSLDPRPYLNIQPTNYSIEGTASSLAVVRAARELHNSSLECLARARAPHDVAPAELAARLQVRVTYPPSFVISRWPGFGVSLMAGGAAALRCDVDANPKATAWWQRDSATPTSPPEPDPAPLPPGTATLRFPALTSAHAGWYRCRARWMHQDYSSIGYYLNVHDASNESEPAPPSAAPEEPPEHQRVEVPVGGNVQLNCPKGSVGCWWRRDNGSEGWTPAGSQHAHGALGIKDALYQEGGEYRCVGARQPDLARLRELKRVTLKVTGAATATALSSTAAGSGWRLECGVCGRGVRAWWLTAAGAQPAVLRPDGAHCWRTELIVRGPAWCAAAGALGGAVAAFPAPATPAPARHVVSSSLSLAPTLSLIVGAALSFLRSD